MQKGGKNVTCFIRMWPKGEFQALRVIHFLKLYTYIYKIRDKITSICFFLSFRKIASQRSFETGVCKQYNHFYTYCSSGYEITDSQTKNSP